MRSAPVTGAFVALVVLAAIAPCPAGAQGLEIRFLGVDMYGGTVWPRSMDLGVSFGARVGLATLFDRSVRLGPALDWWTAPRRRSPVDVRGVSVHLDGWREFRSSDWLRPHVGAGLGLLSTDAGLDTDDPVAGMPPPVVSELSGYRFRAGLFAGATVRLTGTGALWMIVEYGYTVVSRFSHHQLRFGVRLLLADS